MQRAVARHCRATRIEDVVERGLLIGLAHRRLGGISDAADVAQETYLRWYKLAPSERQAIESPVAWCVRVAARLSLDIVRSAHHRHEHCVGSWLHDAMMEVERPARSSASDDPADVVTLDESVSLAMGVVLDVMTPAERVPFVLHEVF